MAARATAACGHFNHFRVKFRAYSQPFLSFLSISVPIPFLLLILCLQVSLSSAALIITSPVSNTTLHASTESLLSWADNGSLPLVSSYGLATITLKNSMGLALFGTSGNNSLEDDIMEQVIATNVNVSGGVAAKWWPDPGIGWNGANYVITIEARVGLGNLTATSPLFAMTGMQYASSSAFLSGVAPKQSKASSPQDVIYITTGAVLGSILMIWFVGVFIYKRKMQGPHAYAGSGGPTETRSGIGIVGERVRRWRTEMPERANGWRTEISAGVSRLIASTKEKVISAPAKREAASSTAQLNLRAAEEGRGGGEPPSLSPETPTTPPSTTYPPRNDHTIEEVPRADNWWTVRDEKVVLSWTGEAGESGVAGAGVAAPAFSPASTTSGNPVSATPSNSTASPSTSGSPSRRSVPVPAPRPNSNMKPYSTEPYAQDVGPLARGSSSQAPAGPSSPQASSSSSSSPRGAPPIPNMSTKPSRTRSTLETLNPPTTPSATSVSNAGATVGSQKKDSEDGRFRVENYEGDAGGRLSLDTEPPPGYHDVNPQPQPSEKATTGSGAIDAPRLRNHDGDGPEEDLSGR